MTIKAHFMSILCKHLCVSSYLVQVELKRDELLASFEQTVLRKQQEADLPNIVMERKVQAVEDRLEEVQAQLQTWTTHTDLTDLTNKEEVLLDIHSL